MTFTYKNVYVKNTSTIGGIYESKGPLSKYFDKVLNNDLYFGEKSFEKAEVYLIREAVSILLRKSNLIDKDIDLVISGDLQNQIAASSYAFRNYNIPFLGIYNACATSSEGMIIGSNLVGSKKIKRCIVTTSSHNMVSEKQFRNPTEYGTLKPDYATWTVTGGASILLSNEKSDVRVSAGTIGKVIDLGVKDVNNMGAVMAPAAGDTIYRHLKDLKRDISYYDMVLTGDLGKYGKRILIDYMKREYDIDISNNYDDCGTMIYAGGSGPVCSALVGFGYIYSLLKKKSVKRVLFVPTGALFSPSMFFQKESLPAIAHAVSLEVEE